MSFELEVSRSNPCQICKKPDWCRYSQDGSAMCRRVAGECELLDSNGELYWVYTSHPATSSLPRYAAPVLPESADPDVLNRVYLHLLSLIELSDRHRKDLIEVRKFTPQDVERLGFKSVSGRQSPSLAKQISERFPEAWQSVPGLFQKDGRPALGVTDGLIIPCRDSSGLVIALKLRRDQAESGSRYFYLSSTKHGGPTCGSPVAYWGTVPGADELTVRVTEGELKAALASSVTQTPTLSVPGIGQLSSQVLIGALKRTGCKKVLLAPDSDAMTNQHVRRSVRGGIESLVSSGFEVKIETWPSQYKGIDDALADGLSPKPVSPESYLETLPAVETSSGPEAETVVVSETEQTGPDLFAGWERPIPLEHDPKPPFPCSVLPDGLREYVVSIGEALQVPVDLVALSALVVIATAVQKRVDLERREDDVLPLNLYALMVYPSGGGKSRLMKELEAPLGDWDRSQQRRVREQNEANSVVRQELEDGLKRLQALKERSSEEEGELKSIRARLVDAQEKGLPELVFTDVTPEAIETKLLANDCRLTLWSAEGGDMFEILGGRYSNGSANLGIVLKGYSQESGTSSRLTRGTHFLHKPTLSMALAVQPIVFEKVAARSDFVKRGLVARFLLAYPASLIGHRKQDPKPIPKTLRDLFRSRIGSLLSIQVSRDGEDYAVEHKLSLEAPAARATRKFLAWAETELQTNGSLGDCQEFGARLGEQMMKVAGLLHCWVYPVSPWEHCVALDSVEAAIEIVKWSAEHVRLSFGQEDDSKVDRCSYLLERIKSRQDWKTGFYLRDLFHLVKKKNWYREQPKLLSDLEHLVEHGYLREAHSGQRTGRPTRLFLVSPYLYSPTRPTIPTKPLEALSHNGFPRGQVSPTIDPRNPRNFQADLSFVGRLEEETGLVNTAERPLGIGSSDFRGYCGSGLRQKASEPLATDEPDLFNTVGSDEEYEEVLY